MQAPLAECHKGIVRELRDGQALVALTSAGQCRGCVSEKICHPVGGKEVKILCQNPHNLPVDSEVLIAYGAKPQFWASVVLFALPVIGLIAGAMFGSRLWPDHVGYQVLAAVILAAMLVIPGFILEQQAQKKKGDWLPTIYEKRG